jgi:hypothetical protein
LPRTGPEEPEAELLPLEALAFETDTSAYAISEEMQ